MMIGRKVGPSLFQWSEAGNIAVATHDAPIPSNVRRLAVDRPWKPLAADRFGTALGDVLGGVWS